jgi:2-polyprenyl-3-methyl-5-hydroxy-6-metoxy-1,4-benzoquinol methylase
MKKTIALNLIMKDEAEHIDRFFSCLDLSQFDEVVVVDTGSTDNSKELVGKWGEKVNIKLIDFPWDDNFAAARQFALDNTTSDYMLWADLDDEIVGTEKLREIIRQNPHPDSFMMKYNYAIIPTTGQVVCELWRERLIKRGIWRWKGKLHEVLITDYPFQQVECNEIYFNHRQKVTVELVEARKERNIKILLKSIEEEPEEPRTYYYLGNSYLGIQKYDEAEKYFLEHIARSGWTEEKYQSYCKISRIRITQNRFEEAKQILTEAIVAVPQYPLAYYIMAEIFYTSRDYFRALNFVNLGLSLPVPKILAAENPSDYTYVPLITKAEILMKLQQYDEALELAQKTFKDVPDEEVKDKLRSFLYQTDELGRRRKMLKAFVEIRKYLIANDETLKAAKLTQCIPYTMETDDLVKQMKVFDNKNIMQDQSNLANAVGEDIPNEHLKNLDKYNFKAAWISTWLSLHPEVKTILDVGCNWGWFTFWLESRGYEVTGYDINPEILEVAEKKKSEFNYKSEFVSTWPQRKFDLVICLDVLEHTIDDAAFMDLLFDHAKDYVVLATPHGCFSRGISHDSPDGMPQPHLRVYTPKKLKEVCKKYYVEDLTRIANDQLMIGAIKRFKQIPKMKIGIFCGRTPEPWGPDAIIRGCGGSEEAVLQMAYRLVARGCDVEVFNQPPYPYSILGGVLWLDQAELDPLERYDVLIDWRNSNIFNSVLNYKAEQKYIWLHDVPHSLSRATVEKVDGIFVLSEFHKSLLPNFAKDKAIVTGNGIDLGMFENIKRENHPHKMVWTSSYIRGLEPLLISWKDIKKRVPDAELHIMYGWETTDVNPPFPRPQYIEWKNRIEDLMKQPGITHYGRLPQSKVVEIMAQCGVFPYYTAFPEISCISCMKAQAAGAVPITSDYGALAETNKSGLMLPLCKNANPYTDYEMFTDALVGLLKDEDEQKELRQKGLGKYKDFAWEGITDQWYKIFAKEK